MPFIDEGAEAVAEAMRSLLALPETADAVFCYNDSTALAAMKFCLNEGMKIPTISRSSASTTLPPPPFLR